MSALLLVCWQSVRYIADMIELLFPLVLAVAMLLVIYYDASRYIIPNWLNAGLLVFYVAWVFLAPTTPDWPMALAAFGGLLLFGFLFFALGMLGAGDVKLLAVLALYLGVSMALVEFLLYMAMLGGLLSMVAVSMRKIMKNQEKKPRIFTPKAPVPYGLAIAAAFVIMLLKGAVVDMPALWQAGAGLLGNV